MEREDINEYILNECISRAYPSKNGLYPHELRVLARAYKYFPSENDFAGYWFLGLHINDVQAILSSLQKRGFIEEGSLSDMLNLLTIPTLKAELKECGLKCTGVKQDLITRLIENADCNLLNKKYPRKPYVLTSKGKEELAENEYILDIIECAYNPEISAQIEQLSINEVTIIEEEKDKVIRHNDFNKYIKLKVDEEFSTPKTIWWFNSMLHKYPDTRYKTLLETHYKNEVNLCENQELNEENICVVSIAYKNLGLFLQNQEKDKEACYYLINANILEAISCVIHTMNLCTLDTEGNLIVDSYTEYLVDYLLERPNLAHKYNQFLSRLENDSPYIENYPLEMEEDLINEPSIQNDVKQIVIDKIKSNVDNGLQEIMQKNAELSSLVEKYQIHLTNCISNMIKNSKFVSDNNFSEIISAYINFDIQKINQLYNEFYADIRNKKIIFK